MAPRKKATSKTKSSTVRKNRTVETTKKPRKSAAKKDVPETNVGDILGVERIEWMERSVALSQLKPYEHNPRRISESAFKALKKSIERDGYHQRIIATHDLRVIGGHQRIRALKELGYKHIAVLTPDKPIDDEQFKEILVRDNLPYGEFDFDILSTLFDPPQLIDMGMPEDWLPKMDDFQPGTEEEQGKLDERKEIEATCPECGHNFTV